MDGNWIRITRGGKEEEEDIMTECYLGGGEAKP